MGKVQSCKVEGAKSGLDRHENIKIEQLCYLKSGSLMVQAWLHNMSAEKLAVVHFCKKHTIRTLVAKL